LENTVPLQWLGHQVGFGPGPAGSGHGTFINPDVGPHNRYHNYEIGFLELIAGLNFTQSTSDNPPNWTAEFPGYTCSSRTIDAAKSVGITLPMTKFPNELGNKIPPNNPPDH